ncbi:MAG: sugar phosphate isomerase/epimerase family protein, partial [Christensenellaceae bacterium]
MKKGASFFSFAQDANIKEAMGHCAKAGYDGIELILSENGYLNLQTSDKEVLDMKNMANDFGLETHSVGVWSLWDHNLVSDNEKTRKYAESIIERQLDIAALLKADTILVVPGYVGCDFAAVREFVRYDIAYERAQESLAKLAKHAQQVKVNIGVENVWNRFLLSPIEMCRFVDEIASDYAGVYFDVGNIIYIGYPQ